jgi:peptidoglycan/LPS O-acetylase OafA/YrhL
MLETFVVLWIAGTFCMTLDHLRQYRMAVLSVKSIVSYSIFLVHPFVTEDAFTLYAKQIQDKFNEKHSYLYTSIIAVITMSLVWPLALYALIFNQERYEKRMQSNMLARFDDVVAMASQAISIALMKQNNLVEGIFPDQEEA